MIRRAADISTQTINERRRIQLEGRLIGDIALASGQVLLVQVDADTEVEIGGKDT